jgi:hypothetical protein
MAMLPYADVVFVRARVRNVVCNYTSLVACIRDLALCTCTHLSAVHVPVLYDVSEITYT